MMTRILTLGLALAVLGVGACTHTDTVPRFDEPEPVEPVLAWRQSRNGNLLVRVFSNGCTNKDSFDAVATGSPRAGWVFYVTLTRVEPDTCEAMLPQGVELVWTADELGLPATAPMTLTNPVDTYRSVAPQPVG